jgi:UDP-N-acetyl-L-fucosamine synthase
MINPKKLKIMTIVGTRPEIIRLSRILVKLDEYFDHILVYTKQSYSYELSDIFFDELGIRKPNHLLDVKSETLGGQIANIIKQAEEVILKEDPDAILVLGDTNSTLSTINAKRLKIPIFHMEAGNRSFDWDVPEEVNRRIVDHISDYNLCYTEHARRYLIKEGLDQKNIFVTGSPLREVLLHYKNKIDASSILGQLKLKKDNYFLVSTHREENVDNENRLRELFSSFEILANQYGLPIIVSLHPRTKKKIEEKGIRVDRLVKFYKPFGYFDYCNLQKNALCVLSDSGTIQEESAILNFKAIQVRVSTERPEAFDSGSIVLVGFNKNSIISAVKLVIDLNNKGEEIIMPLDYRDTNVSTKVIKLIMGVVGINKYDGRKF